MPHHDSTSISQAESLSFEQKLQRLADIISQLESGQVALSEAVTLFEEGTSLHKSCSEELTTARAKLTVVSAEAREAVKELANKNPQGELQKASIESPTSSK